MIRLAEAEPRADDTAGEVSNLVEPQTLHWRRGVGEILEWFGIGLNYDEVPAIRRVRLAAVTRELHSSRKAVT